MDDSAVERARERIEQRGDAVAVDALLERARTELAALVEAASAAATGLPERVEVAVQNALQEQVKPVGRNLAEIRGLMNQAIGRLERLEGESVDDRHARVDDLSLLVDVISAGWQSVDARLARMESIVSRLEQTFEQRSGAIVYRMEDRRPDAAEQE